MYSAKIQGGTSGQITNQSTSKAIIEAAVKEKKAFSQTPVK